MEPMQTDNGATLTSLQTSSSPPPSPGGPPFESDPHHGIELLHSGPFSLTSEMSTAGDDVEEVCPQGDHASGTFDFPAAHHSYRLDNETADVIIETEVLSSGLSSFSSKQFAGNPTSVTELVDSIPTFPSHPCAGGSGPGPRPVGQESADVNFLNEGDAAIAVQFASPAVVASQDDDIADIGERTPSPCEIVGYVSPSPPSFSSRVDFVYPVVVTDPIDVVVEERSSSWEWPPRFAEEHEYEVPSPFAMAEDNSAAIKERAPETSSPCHYTAVGVQFSSRSRVAANANDNDDVMQDEESAAYERRELVDSPPLSYAPSATDGSDHNGDVILEPESFRGERAEFVPFSRQPYTMISGIASLINVADDDIVVVQELESSSNEIPRPLSPPSSTMAVDFVSPTDIAFDSDVAPADVPQPPLENLVADDYACPLAVKNDDDVLGWEETVADKTASPVSVPHDDIVIVQEAMTVKMSSSVVVRDDDGTVAEDRMIVEFASPAVAQNDDGVVVEDIIAFKSPSPAVTNDDVGVVEDAMVAEFASSEVVSNDDVVVLQDLCAVEFTSRAIFLDEDPMVVQETNVDRLGAPNVVRDDVVVTQEAVAVIPPSPAADRDDCAVGVEDAAAVELVALDAVPGDTAVIVQDREAVEIASSAVAAHDDGVVLQDSSQFASLGSSRLSPPPGGTGVVVSSSAVAVEDKLVLQGQTSSSFAGPRHESSFTPALVNDSKTGQYKEGSQRCATGDVSPGEQPACISLPKVFEVPVGVEQTSNAAEPSSEALEVAYPRESPSSPGDANFVFMNGPEGAPTLLAAEQAHEVDDDIFYEQHPAKKAKTSGTIYSGTDAVAVVLGQTAEIVLVLAGMAQMRAGKVPTSYESELATSAYQKLGILVSQLAPNDLVAKESLERMLQDYNKKKVAQKKREDLAWMEALNEAEALANVRTETLARAKAEAAARVQAEVAARAQAGVAARAQVEAEELEHRQEAAMKAAAANGPSKGGYSSVGGSPLSSGQSAYRAPELTQSPSFPTPAVHHNSNVEIGSQIPSPITKATEIPRSVNSAEKSISVNGQSHAPISKPSLGRPPKVRNRVRKEPATVTIFTPEFLNEVQSQAPDPQKAHLTHKQLCAGVQQFIREHVPPVSQNLQALSPTYISTPFPCQVCKLIAKDTGSVLVCDSCDEVSHVKCVQPPSSRGASKGDWNCPKCLTASRGAKCPSKYGPIRPGSPNSVKLWPPHDTSAGNSESIRSSTNGPVRDERGSATAGRQIGPVLLKVQGKTGLEIDTRAHQVMDDPSTGNLGSSPHLIVHLVNEPSPRPSNPVSGPSNLLLQHENQALFPPGKSGSSLVQETSALELLTKEISTEDQTELIGQIPATAIQIDSLKTVHTDEKSEGVLEKTYTLSAAVAEDTVPEAKSRRATPVQIKKTETRTQTIQSKKGNVESGLILPAKQADVPLPIVMEWVGESTRRAEGKVYYRACSVGGITFSVSDCALFRPETPDVPPYIARLQVLWEDIATGHKWVRVSWCYYPTDIPMAMGRPGTTAPDEVYESNHCDNNLVGSIQGPCFVLPPLKFMEEMESRRTLKKRGDAVDELPPIFLSRWMYDAPKGVFRPLQE